MRGSLPPTRMVARDPRPLREGLEGDLRPEGDAAERVDAPAELAVDEGNELGGIVLDRGERSVRAGVPVEHGEHDTVPVGGEQVGDCPVVPPREAAPVQEHRRPRARAERVSDHLDPFDGDIARAAPLEAPASLGRRMGARPFSSRGPHYTGGAREFSTWGLSARSSRHETLWNTGRRFARSGGRLSTFPRTNVQKRWLTCTDGLFFSSPAEQDPKGLAEPTERPRRAQPVAGLERCGG